MGGLRGVDPGQKRPVTDKPCRGETCLAHAPIHKLPLEARIMNLFGMVKLKLELIRVAGRSKQSLWTT